MRHSAMKGLEILSLTGLAWVVTGYWFSGVVVWMSRRTVRTLLLHACAKWQSFPHLIIIVRSNVLGKCPKSAGGLKGSLTYPDAGYLRAIIIKNSRLGRGETTHTHAVLQSKAEPNNETKRR